MQLVKNRGSLMMAEPDYHEEGGDGSIDDSKVGRRLDDHLH